MASIVIGGNVYDGRERGVRAQLAFRDGVDRLAREGIPSFVIQGNHNPVEEGWSAIRKWPDGVTVFGAGEVATIPVERDGQTLACIRKRADRGKARAAIATRGGPARPST